MFTREQVKKAVHKLGRNAGLSSSSTDGNSSNNKTLSKILRHVQHFLSHLGWNVDSLATAIECVMTTVLAENWVKSIQGSSAWSGSDGDKTTSTTSRSSLDHVMQHVFSTLLRLHDGLILITSGECRHEADQRAARASHFPSRLTTQASDKNSNNGGGGASSVTVYRSDGIYSGTGWDEWSDPTNGLQARLIRASGRPWNVLSKGTGMEGMLERLETEIRNLEDSFSRLKAAGECALLPPLQRALRASNVKIRLTFQCKMETMAVQAPAAKYSMEWKRLAGQFQLGETVLPQRISRDEWKKLLSVPMSAASAAPVNPFVKKESKAQKRKRQCLLDDSEEEEPDEAAGRDKLHGRGGVLVISAAPEVAVATVTSTGLVVEQKQRRRDAVACISAQAVGSTNDTPSESINDIKASMGVNVTELEVSHAALQEEEGVTFDEAQRIDSLEESQMVERKYKALRKELDRAVRKTGQSREDDNDDLIWDLRDAARLAAMEAGNHNLSQAGSDPDQVDSVDRRALLDRALFFFKQALELVEDQQRLHVSMTRRRRGEADATSVLFQRNLLFLKGQAHVNSGIALVGLFRLKPKSSWMEQATQFELSLQSVESLLEQARNDKESSIDAKLDEIKANELRLLVSRWRCTLNWISGARAQAIEMFQTIGSGEMSAFDDPIPGSECASTALKVRIELYHWCVTLADLVAAALEGAAVSRIQQKAAEYDSLLVVYEEAVDAAARQSVLLHTYMEQLDSLWLPDAEILEENGVLTEDELRHLLQETKDWWSKKKGHALKPIHVDEGTRRVDQSTLLSEANAAMPEYRPRRLVIYGSFPRKPRPRRKVLGEGSKNAKTTTNRRAPQPEPRKYRRWGDELLPQVLDENGRLVPKLEYPTLAPEMPPDIKELFDSLRLESAR